MEEKKNGFTEKYFKGLNARRARKPHCCKDADSSLNASINSM